jgi:hypothetical protein
LELCLIVKHGLLIPAVDPFAKADLNWPIAVCLQLVDQWPLRLLQHLFDHPVRRKSHQALRHDQQRRQPLARQVPHYAPLQ